MPIDDILDEPMAAEVRAAFTALTDPLAPAAGDADRMVRAGRRRLHRRRAAATVSAVAASAVLGVGTTATVTAVWRDARSLVGAPTPAPSPTFEQGPYADLYRQPTRGDLADEAAYLAAVVAAWDASHGTAGSSLTSGLFDDLRGAPHVVWAGTTPAGPAAVVAQPAWWAQRGPHATSDELMVTLVGLVGVDENGAPKVVADDYQPISAWFVDPGLTTLVVADLGSPVSYSTGWSQRPDGTWFFEEKPVQFHDGAAVIRLPREVDVCAVRLTTAPGPSTIAGAPDPDGAHQPRPVRSP
jgi:hypothetical protein